MFEKHIVHAHQVWQREAVAPQEQIGINDPRLRQRGQMGDVVVAGPVVIRRGAVTATVAVPLFAMQSIWLVYLATALWVTAIVAASATTFTFVSIVCQLYPPLLGKRQEVRDKGKVEANNSNGNSNSNCKG